MKLHVLFGQRKQSYDGQLAPEVLVCWDEFCVDENPDGFQQVVDQAVVSGSADFTAFKVILISFDGNQVARLLNGAPIVNGHVVTEP